MNTENKDRATRLMGHIGQTILLAGLLWSVFVPAQADEPALPHRGHAVPAPERAQGEGDEVCTAPTSGALEGLQIETSDIKLFEAFFESILHAETVLRKDHPQKDMLRGFCYRGVLIVIRQDVQQPRPTGWIQVNFAEDDASRLQEEIQRAYEHSSVFKLEESERNRIIRLKLKPDVRRGGRKATRLEVFGPEGFMLGFDQFK